ncbi:MAG: alkaline phosphatase family protein [Acidobacteria bacterium]|nr:alkaline phosphatase family protein [Acidobacteriota bacterium]
MASTGRQVIIISIDGMMPEIYTSPRNLGLHLPNIEMLTRQGAYAEGLEGVFPSVTYPSHATLVTGVRPAKHGIENNRVFVPPDQRPSNAWYWFAKELRTEPIWMTARRAGLVTAAVSWPVTAGADIDHNAPEIWKAGENPLTWKRILEECTPGLAPIIRASIREPSEVVRDESRTAVSEQIIERFKPGLMLIHLTELDHVQHTYGPRTPEAMRMVEKQDGYIGRIVEATRRAGTFDQTTFLIVSDHGFMPVRKRFLPNVLLAREKLITLDSAGKVVSWKAVAWPSSGGCGILLKSPEDRQTLAKAVSLFEKVALKPGSPIRRVIRRNELDRLGSYPRAAFALEASPGFVIDWMNKEPALRDSGDYRGTHGQLPSRAEMRASLILFGPGARRGARIPLARMIDVAPTVAALLGLRFPKVEGTPLRALIKIR